MTIRPAMARMYATLAGAMAVLALSAPGHAADRPTITLPQGRLAGTTEKGLHVFKDIPYALPPVGSLRWRPPQPPARWQGTRDAGAFGPSCIQAPISTKSLYYDLPARTSEDCLTLNVWAPADAAGAPVVVWIHGGSLRVGGAAEPIYDGADFAKRGVVFVSINYRLGVLGYLADPALSAESPDKVSGNYGLLDQIAALRWVREHVAAFGGDAHNVTIMGESAGALSVSYLLTSPLARGLFDKAIAESTNTRAVPALKRAVYGLPSAENIGKTVADKLGAERLADLRAMDAQKLTNAAAKAKFVPQGTIDGHVLPHQVVETFDLGEQAKVPLLAGFNSGETRSQRAFLPKPPASAEAYRAAIRKGYGDLAPAFLRLYPASDIEESMLATLRDSIFGWATERMIRKQSEAGQPAYMYLFDHCYPAARKRDLCAFHASELPFVFGQVGPAASLPPNWPRPEGPDEQRLSGAMIGFWVNFARTGDPASPKAAAWHPYADNQAYMHFTDRPMADHDPVPGMFEMEEAFVSRRRAADMQWFLNVGVSAPPVNRKTPR